LLLSAETDKIAIVNNTIMSVDERLVYFNNKNLNYQYLSCMPDRIIDVGLEKF